MNINRNFFEQFKNVQVAYQNGQAIIDLASVKECDFSLFFLGYKWVFGLDLFKKIYGY